MSTFSRPLLSRLALLLLLAAPSVAHAAAYELDPDHTTVGFKVRHMMMSDVAGAFRQVQGAAVWDDKDITRSTVEVTIATSSVDTQAPKRDDHLRSPDFLNVEKFPTMTFKSTRVQRAGGNNLKVTGNLTIRDVSRPVTLLLAAPAKPVLDPFGMTRTAIKATTKIKRKDFALEWNKALETGGVLVGEDVAIEINAEFIKKGAEAPVVPSSG